MRSELHSFYSAVAYGLATYWLIQSAIRAHSVILRFNLLNLFECIQQLKDVVRTHRNGPHSDLSRFLSPSRDGG